MRRSFLYFFRWYAFLHFCTQDYIFNLRTVCASRQKLARPLVLACVAGGLSRCDEQRSRRHFVLVADGKLRASDEITGPGVVADWKTTPHPLPLSRTSVTSPQSPTCRQYRALVYAVYRIDWDRQLRRLPLWEPGASAQARNLTLSLSRADIDL